MSSIIVFNQVLSPHFESQCYITFSATLHSSSIYRGLHWRASRLMLSSDRHLIVWHSSSPALLTNEALWLSSSNSFSQLGSNGPGSGKSVFERMSFDVYSAVGQFKDLVESTEKDMPLQETLRKVLNFTSKGWDAAKAHAMKAVETDNRMRIWLSDDSHKNGLLFRCNLGRVDLDAPIGKVAISKIGFCSVQMSFTVFFGLHCLHCLSALRNARSRCTKRSWE